MDRETTRPYRFGDLLSLARQSWVQQLRARMASAGFPGYRRTDAVALRLLAGRPWSMGQLGDVLGVTRQAARKLADGLVERGYAAFGTDPDDARRTMVHLTPSGAAYARRVAAAQDALNSRIGDDVSEGDLAIADNVLRSVFPDTEARRRVDEIVPRPATEGAVRGSL